MEPEDEDYMFFRNVGFSPNYMVLQRRRQHSSGDAMLQNQGFDIYKNMFLRFVFLFKDTVVIVVKGRGFEHASHSPMSFSVTGLAVALIKKCFQFKRQQISSP
jgi:hypothetical protein